MLWRLHANNVAHYDFETRNVLRAASGWRDMLFRPWIRFLMVDFALADTDHVCPGWEKCKELQKALEALKLVSLAKRVKELKKRVQRIRRRLRVIPILVFVDKQREVHPVILAVAFIIIVIVVPFILHLLCSHFQ